MRRIWALALLTSSFWFGPEALGQVPGGAKGEKYALLVGVRQYETPDLRALKYSESDVEELAKVLIKSGYRPENVKLMTQRRGAEETRYLPVSSKKVPWRAWRSSSFGGGDPVLAGVVEGPQGAGADPQAPRRGG